MYFVGLFFFFLMIRRPPRSTQSRSSAASDVYKRQYWCHPTPADRCTGTSLRLSLIHISEPTRLGMISYAVFCLKKKKTTTNTQNTLIYKHHKNKTILYTLIR